MHILYQFVVYLGILHSYLCTLCFRKTPLLPLLLKVLKLPEFTACPGKQEQQNATGDDKSLIVHIIYDI